MLSRDVYIHEAGHLFIGLQFGVNEQGIVFAGLKPGEAAAAWFILGSPMDGARRSLAGLLAHIELHPENIPDHLLAIYKTSIILDDATKAQISPDEADFMSGAKTDLFNARNFAAQINAGDIVTLLRSVELEIKAIISDNRNKIEAIANDIEEWHRTTSPDDNPMMLYPVERAQAAILAA